MSGHARCRCHFLSCRYRAGASGAQSHRCRFAAAAIDNFGRHYSGASCASYLSKFIATATDRFEDAFNGGSERKCPNEIQRLASAKHGRTAAVSNRRAGSRPARSGL